MSYDNCSPIFDDDEPLAFSQVVYSVGAARTVVSMVSHFIHPCSAVVIVVCNSDISFELAAEWHDPSNVAAAAGNQQPVRGQ